MLLSFFSVSFVKIIAMQNILIKRSVLCSKLTCRIAVCAFVLLPILMVSCKSRDNENAQWIERCSVVADRVVADGDTMIVCDYSAVKESVRIPFSMWVDELEVVKLDNSSDEALIGFAWPLEITENYIGINVDNAPFRIFTRQGKFVTCIGSIGQGPGEYTLIYDHQIDEAHNRVYLLPWTTKQILVYDLQGNFIGIIPLPYLVHLGQIHVDYDKQRVAIMQLSFKNKNILNDGISSPPVWVQDLEGNIVHENKAPQLALSGGYGNGIRFCEKRANHYVFSMFRTIPDVADSLYTYLPDDNRLSPQFTVNFGNEMPKHDYRDYGDYYYTYIWGANNTPRFMHIFTAIVVNRIVVDKRTLKGAFYEMKNDYLGGIALDDQWWTWTEYGYAACMDPGDLLDLIEERLADPKISTDNREFLNVWKSEISPDDNSYVILGKWKNRVD